LESRLKVGLEVLKVAIVKNPIFSDITWCISQKVELYKARSIEFYMDNVVSPEETDFCTHYTWCDPEVPEIY
jgi:hypothetical protein